MCLFDKKMFATWHNESYLLRGEINSLFKAFFLLDWPHGCQQVVWFVKGRRVRASKFLSIIMTKLFSMKKQQVSCSIRLHENLH